ncbi:hypothetical protein GTY88_33390, partial [Streptomyces sp. SID5926]|nr:hypothetical protein [Streptomyces sp. SID5926]
MKPRAGDGVGAHETAEQTHGERGLAAARAAAHRDDRTLTPAFGPCGLTGGGQVSGRSPADPHERILLVSHQGEPAAALKVGPDMVEETA